MALAYFVVMKVGPSMSLFVDGEQVHSGVAPSAEELQKDFFINFPMIYDSAPMFVRKGNELRFYINDVLMSSVESDFEQVKDDFFYFEAVGSVRLPVLTVSDEDMMEIVSNGNFISVVKLLSELGFPQVAKQLETKLKPIKTI